MAEAVAVFMGAAGDLAEAFTAAHLPEARIAAAALARIAAAMEDSAAAAAMVGMDMVIPVAVLTAECEPPRGGEEAQEVDGQIAVGFRMPL